MAIFQNTQCRILRRALLPILAGLLFSAPLQAEVRLPRLVGDGMVLQRNTPLKIWGWADPGEKVTLQFRQKRYSATADAKGDWQVTLPQQATGGPDKMEIRGENSIRLNDILVGDVWLCSGQSNMEYPLGRIMPPYGEPLHLQDNPLIRQFLVPQHYDFNTPQKDLADGSWKTAIKDNLPEFSAVAYFFADETFRREAVPIGLINASLGGSPAESWLSESALKKFPQLYAELQRFKDAALIEKIQQQDQSRIQAWYDTADKRDRGNAEYPWSSAQLQTDGWHQMTVPGYWADTAVGEQQGVVWFRRTFDVPEDLAGKAGILALGRIVDADTTFINGTKVGNTTYLYPRRRYPVPEGLLKAGKNTIAIRVTNERGRGGFVADKPYRITFAAPDEQRSIDLRGSWQFKVGAKMEPLAGQTFVRWKPTGLYNGMIHPLENYAIKGAIWYQGESNVGRAEEYRQLFPAMIRDWRNRRGNNFPFVFIQLANFLEPSTKPTDSDWARLREAQASALTLPATTMATAIDIGEWNDIHPLNKREAGRRFALAAQTVAYRKSAVVGSGPQFKSLDIDGDQVTLKFDHTAGGLVARGGQLQRFAIAGKDRHFHWADARIEGNRVILHSDRVARPIAVRYAWADNPAGANLYNSAGLPAVPFRTDSWGKTVLQVSRN
ncbi:sialate O-acetylesterase [Microbulbifer hainanensis]|uniref:sialate O-acetylesterase n=1 Tax=Microbulbifer hainanensis TaxID=2735675 RepID=UPI001867299F|nr:sialate O-acetylesterase [Microbulbifer hainanensis]